MTTTPQASGAARVIEGPHPERHLGGPDDHAWRSDCPECIRSDRDKAYQQGYTDGYLATRAAADQRLGVALEALGAALWDAIHETRMCKWGDALHSMAHDPEEGDRYRERFLDAVLAALPTDLPLAGVEAGKAPTTGHPFRPSARYLTGYRHGPACGDCGRFEDDPLHAAAPAVPVERVERCAFDRPGLEPCGLDRDNRRHTDCYHNPPRAIHGQQMQCHDFRDPTPAADGASS